MSRGNDIREGMQVYGADEQVIGTVERIHGDGFHVKGQHYTRDMVARVAQDRVYLRGTGTSGGRAATGTGQATAGELRVPVAEERLTVDKREAELGEVAIRKTVTEEERTVPVTLRRDEVHVEEVNVQDRPLRADDDAFNEGTIRVPLRGEEAVVDKEAVVTGEVVVNKETTAREEQVSGTVRQQHVDVENAYRQARGGLEQAHTTRAGSTGRTFEQAEPNYRSGFTAAHDDRYAGREFEDVEPDLRTRHTASGGGDPWERLREEVREGWNRARGR
jgi:uncharacterized protein (TIGR02271 family)